MATELTYYIYEGLLTGFADGAFIHVHARSGEGGGSTKTVSTFVSNNPYATGVKTSGTGAKHQHGGPVPLGYYKIHAPAHHHTPWAFVFLRADPQHTAARKKWVLYPWHGQPWK